MKKQASTSQKRTYNLAARIIGLILAGIQTALAVVVILMAVRLNVFPDKYILIAGIVLGLISAYDIFSQFTRVHIPGKIISVLVAALLVVGCFYMAKTFNALDLLTGQKTETHQLEVIVMKNDPASSLTDAKDYTFGYVSKVDDTNINTAITKIDEKMGSSIKVKSYDSWKDLTDALYNGDIQSIILNESFRSTVNEVAPDFDSSTRILDSFTIETTIALSTSEKQVNKEPFIIYVAGNDEEGTLTTSGGRNDVNILAVVNPVTRQILLLSTPRDSYIDITDNSGVTAKDKLTHAGTYGIKGSITALNKLYGLNIDYYFRVNFTGCVGIVDALDGITINSDVEFETTPDTSPVQYSFTVGPNECDGDKTLAFCRERHAFANGDLQRGKDQMAAIQGIFSKATSPAILTNYTQVLDSMNGLFITDMPSSSITALVKGILSDASPWTLQTYSCEAASTGMAYSALEKMDLSMVFLNDQSVEISKKLVDKIEAGEVFDVNEYVSNYKAGQTN